MENKSKKLILETIETLLELQLRAVKLALNKEEPQTGTFRQQRKKRKSLVNLCAEILTEEARSIHVDELIEILRKRDGRVTDRDSLASALAKKAKSGVLVRRIAPATFEILERR